MPARHPRAIREIHEDLRKKVRILALNGLKAVAKSRPDRFLSLSKEVITTTWHHPSPYQLMVTKMMKEEAAEDENKVVIRHEQVDVTVTLIKVPTTVTNYDEALTMVRLCVKRYS